MVDWILDKVARSTSVDEIHVVTNARFAADVPSAGQRRRGRPRSTTTARPRTRTGSARSATSRFVADGGLDDDLLVIAGDNLFDFRLADYVDFWRAKGAASAARRLRRRRPRAGDAVRDRRRRRGRPDRRLRREARRPADARWPRPRRTSTTASTAAWSQRYLDEGNPPDQPGNFVAWLHPREPVYAYRFDGELVRHRRPRPAARGGQPDARSAGLPRARVRARSDTISTHADTDTSHVAVP